MRRYEKMRAKANFGYLCIREKYLIEYALYYHRGRYDVRRTEKSAY